MNHVRRSLRGFSLVELLIVVGIIAALLAILLPVIVNARKAARSTACLARLQGWGQAYAMYLGSNGVAAIPEQVGDDEMLRWFEILVPYVSDPKAALLCPEAREPRSSNKSGIGSSTQAWRKKTWVTVKPPILRDNWIGSYGFNSWVFGRSRPGGDLKSHVRLSAKESGHVPLIGDCVGQLSLCMTGDAAPVDLKMPDPDLVGSGIETYCIDRHKMAVNIVFLDGHAENVKLARLWKLKWGDAYAPRDVVVPRR